MTVHLTYTSGALDAEIHDEFEGSLQRAREARMQPLAHSIDGKALFDGDVFERADPSRSDLIASRAHHASADLVGRAVAAARDASHAWRRVGHQERASKLRAGADEIRRRHVEIAAVVSLETGKTRTESLAEVQEGIDLITTYCDQINDQEGFVQPLRSLAPTESNSDVLKPYGVFGVISPFNFPFALAINMVSAALVAGNTVVLKPSEEAPWSAALVAETLAAGELPAGVFNLVHGGPGSGRALVGGAVDGIAFTGSAQVGREVVRALQTGRYARPALTEMGGKNAAIVTAHANLEKAAEGVARAAFGLSGQKCSACSRALVIGSVFDEFAELLANFTQQLRVGDAADRDVYTGPVINSVSVTRFTEAVAIARRDGNIVLGGDRPDLPGFFVEPTIITGLPRAHMLTREELFLPVVTVERITSLSEALTEANASDYGLTAGIFTEQEAEIDEFLEGIEAGVVYVNRQAGATTGAWPGAQAFCGWKSSGSTGKGCLGPYYVPQFMREQSQTIVA